MDSILKKITDNLKKGTLLKNGSKALRNRWIKYKKYNRFAIANDPFRAITKMLLDEFPRPDENHTLYGNYFLDNRAPLNAQSIVYSLGIGTHIDFDVAVAEKTGCEVFMYDPTPESVAFMQKQTDPRFRFFPFGVWDHPMELNFYTPPWGGSSSIFPYEEGQKPDFVAQCDTLPSFMEKNGHTHIDVLKMDIEGAGLVVLKNLLAHHIYPTQLVMELERPKEETVVEQISFFADMIQVLKTLKEKGYVVYQIPQHSGIKYFSFEFLCIKR